VNDARVADYLSRIGVRRPERLDADALRDLQRAHLFAVPFENLSLHLGESIVLDEDALLAKLLDRRRGGFCYELNGAFAALLTALGFRVSLLAARVFREDGFGPPFAHLTLRVELEEPWLVDVGFGAFSHHPLRLDATGEQPDPAGVFEVVPQADEIEIVMDGRTAYRAERRERELRDFVPTCWWTETSPDSRFTQGLTCSLPTESGRVTLSGARLIETLDGEREERVLHGDAELLATYRERFGIDLDRVPGRGGDSLGARLRRPS
jgi:N-hydroxyarylamine O-acetyltransferase